MTSNCRHDFDPVPQQVTSERLIIRPSTRADSSYLMKWWNDPAVTDPDGNIDGMNYDDADMDDWFRRYVDGRSCSTHFVICLRKSGQHPIGEFYIASDDRPGSVGLALIIGETDLWGQGYGREALYAYAKALFDSGLVETIRIDTRRDNLRAIHMCDAVGFEVEHVWANGLFQTMTLVRDALPGRHTPVHAGR